MVVEKLPEVNPPSGRVQGQVHRAVPILESRRRRNIGRYHEKGSVLRVSRAGCKYRPMGGTSGWPLLDMCPRGKLINIFVTYPFCS